MRKTARTLAVLAVGVALASPGPATAKTSGVHDRAGDTARAADVTGLRVRHGRDRVQAVATIPGLRARRLSGTELLIQTENEWLAYAVTVLRDRRGRVVDTALSWRPTNDPVEPTPLPCAGIRTALWAGHTAVSVPTSCLTRTRPTQRIRAKVRTTNRALGLRDAYYDDQTPFTRYVERGAEGGRSSGPEGRITARGGLVVRSLPTTASGRKGTLRHGKVYPLSCQVRGARIRRDDDVARRSSDRWYRLPGGAGGEWVSALYVASVDYEPPYCGTGPGVVGHVTQAGLPRFEAPTTRADFHGGLARGTRVRIRCQLRGQRVGGDARWYHLRASGFWVRARHVSGTGASPTSCTG